MRRSHNHKQGVFNSGEGAQMKCVWNSHVLQQAPCVCACVRACARAPRACAAHARACARVCVWGGCCCCWLLISVLQGVCYCFCNCVLQSVIRLDSWMFPSFNEMGQNLGSY